MSLFADRGAGTTVNMRPAEIAFYRAVKHGSPLTKEVGDRTRTHDVAAERVTERAVEGDGPAAARLAAIVITADDLARISVHTDLTNPFTLTVDLYALNVAKIPILRLSQSRHEMCLSLPGGCCNGGLPRSERIA